MKWLIAILIFPLFLFASNPTVEMSGSKVVVKNSFKVNDSADILVKEDLLSLALKKQFYIQKLTLINSKPISQSTTDGITSTESAHYYMVKTNVASMQDMLVTLHETKTTCDSTTKDNKTECITSRKLQLKGPLKIYSNYNDFKISQFTSKLIDLNFSYTCAAKDCSSEYSFEVRNLFFINWLSQMKKTFDLKTTPSLHQVLLTTKDLFIKLDKDIVGGQL